MVVVLDWLLVDMKAEMSVASEAVRMVAEKAEPMVAVTVETRVVEKAGE